MRTKYIAVYLDDPRKFKIIDWAGTEISPKRFGTKIDAFAYIWEIARTKYPDINEESNEFNEIISEYYVVPTIQRSLVCGNT